MVIVVNWPLLTLTLFHRQNGWGLVTSRHVTCSHLWRHLSFVGCFSPVGSVRHRSWKSLYSFAGSLTLRRARAGARLTCAHALWDSDNALEKVQQPESLFCALRRRGIQARTGNQRKRMSQNNAYNRLHVNLITSLRVYSYWLLLSNWFQETSLKCQTSSIVSFPPPTPL